MLSVDEVKQYLRVDSSDDDAFIKDLIPAAESLVRDVGRISSNKPVTGYVMKVAKERPAGTRLNALRVYFFALFRNFSRHFHLGS